MYFISSTNHAHRELAQIPGVEVETLTELSRVVEPFGSPNCEIPRLHRARGGNIDDGFAPPRKYLRFHGQN